MTTSTLSSPGREALRLRSLDHVVVLGANGTMGYGSAALFTNAVPQVTFLARSKDKADEGLAAAVKQVRSESLALRADTGSYDDLASALQTADLVFEAVAEDMDLKKQIFDQVEDQMRPDAIVATVSSGLSINELAAGRSDACQRNFCGLHFFNPPNVIVGTELIASAQTDPEVLDFLEAFCRIRLGRDMVRTSDTPAFAGNRVGFKVLNECAQMAEELGPMLVDAIVGPYTGRALTPLATIDLVGWDVHQAIVDNVHALTNDEAHDTLELPGYMRELIANGTLGNKTGGGFFSRDGDTQTVLDPARGTYVPQDSIELPDMSYVDEVANLYSQARYREGMAVLLTAKGPEAAIARKVMAGYISYSFERVGEVCANISDIDRIMGSGFNWAPPSVLVDFLGALAAAEMMHEAGITVPDAIANADANTRFFDNPNTNRGRFFVAG